MHAYAVERPHPCNLIHVTAAYFTSPFTVQQTRISSCMHLTLFLHGDLTTHPALLAVGVALVVVGAGGGFTKFKLKMGPSRPPLEK